jgi:capsular exopolysaccharide synthesis family protein
MANEIAQHEQGWVAPRPYGAAALNEVDYYDIAQSSETHLRDYWKILRKHARRITIIFCGVMVLALLYNFFSPTTYTASAVLKIEPQNPTVTGVRDMAPAQLETGPYDYYQTQFALLKSQALAARVVKQLKLEANSSFNGENDSFNIVSAVFRGISDGISAATGFITSLFSKDARTGQAAQPAYELGVPPYLVGRYLKYLDVQPVRNTRLVEVIFSTPDPALSQMLANTHPTAFIQMILENRFNLTKEAKDFLSKKLADLREKVQKSEALLQDFREKHGVVSFEKGENIVVDRLVDLNKQLTKAKGDRIEAESLYQMTRNKNTQYLAQVLNNPLIQQLKGTIAGLEAERGRLLSIYTNEHPRAQELTQQIDESRRIINNEIATVLRGIESSYASARAREEALDAEAKRQANTALGLKVVGVDYAVLNEEVAVNRGLYDNVLKRLYETNVANDLAASNFEVMQRAELPQSPSSPAYLRNLIIGAALGLLLAIGTAFFLEYMDATINTSQGVWAAVSLSTLGVVPHLKSVPKYVTPPALPPREKARLIASGEATNEEFVSNELVVARDRWSVIAESYRTIRTALLLSQAEKPPKTVLITSPSPGDGKTVTVLNLGIALAQTGMKVLIIDGDLRRGRCHKILNIVNHRGLANVISGQQRLDECVSKTAIPGVDLLPRGTLPPNPTDLLMSEKMRRVVDIAAADYDHILIDSPPVIAVSDAAVLSSVADGVLLVIDSQRTTTPLARDAVHRLDAVGARMLGVILNGVDLRHPEYQDYQTYYSAYSAPEEDEQPAPAASDDYIIASPEDLDRVVGELGSRPGSFDSSHLRPGVLVPPTFFDRLAQALTEPLGSASAQLVARQIAELRETTNAFPMTRLWELVRNLSGAIAERPQKLRFLRTVSEEIRTLRT